MLCEAVTGKPYNFKPKSSEREKVWESIAAYLNSLMSPELRVTARAVRELEQAKQTFGSCLYICMDMKAALAACRDLLVHHKQSADCRQLCQGFAKLLQNSYISFSTAKLCKTLRLINLFRSKGAYELYVKLRFFYAQRSILDVSESHNKSNQSENQNLLLPQNNTLLNVCFLCRE